MVRTRKERKADSGIELAHPNRSTPSEKTLLDIAEAQKLFEQADKHPANRAKKGYDDDELSPVAERIMDTLLWTVSLAMLHFTLDVLVQNQYAMDIAWSDIIARALVALGVFSVLFYVLHPHPSAPILLPGLSSKLQHPLRQGIFLAASTISGCYLIHITNEYGYIYVMKRSPPLGCIWIWSIIELDLPMALISLAVAGGFYIQRDYSLKLQQ
ncbi:hypothetical protein GGS20DRAFT_573338 [Poronia punctata]|nr:hypothetical protein GGS20DRAFT_573338 [Poronia punctata]